MPVLVHKTLEQYSLRQINKVLSAVSLELYFTSSRIISVQILLSNNKISLITGGTAVHMVRLHKSCAHVCEKLSNQKHSDICCAPGALHVHKTSTMFGIEFLPVGRHADIVPGVVFSSIRNIPPGAPALCLGLSSLVAEAL